jgi:hypothetical protein
MDVSLAARYTSILKLSPMLWTIQPCPNLTARGWFAWTTGGILPGLRRLMTRLYFPGLPNQSGPVLAAPVAGKLCLSFTFMGLMLSTYTAFHRFMEASRFNNSHDGPRKARDSEFKYIYPVEHHEE